MILVAFGMIAVAILVGAAIEALRAHEHRKYVRAAKAAGIRIRSAAEVEADLKRLKALVFASMETRKTDAERQFNSLNRGEQ